MQELVRRQCTLGVEENLFGLQPLPQRCKDRGVVLFGRLVDWYYCYFSVSIIIAPVLIVLFQNDEALRESASLRGILREKGNE